MLVYILLIAMIIWMWQYETATNSSKYATIVFLCILFLFCFRDYSVGVDTIGYIEEYIYEQSNARLTDMGYAYFNHLLKTMGFSPRMFLIICSIIICTPVYAYIMQSAKCKMFPYLLYITIGTFSMHLSGIRQSMAMGIVLLGCVFGIRIQNLFLRYAIPLLSVFLATTIHASSVICYLFIPIIWLSGRLAKIGKLTLVIASILPLLMSVSQLPSYFVEYFMTERYEQYEIGTRSVNIYSFFVIPYIIFLYIVFMMLRFKHHNYYEKFGFFCSTMYAVSAASSLMLPIIARIGFYFSLPTIVLVTSLTGRLPSYERKIYTPIIVVVSITYFLIAVSGGILRIDNYSLGSIYD